MKVISDKIAKGKRRVLVELDDSEQILAFKENEHYKLGYPHGDVVAGNIIVEAERVMWCSAEQGWLA